VEKVEGRDERDGGVGWATGRHVGAGTERERRRERDGKEDDCALMDGAECRGGGQGGETALAGRNDEPEGMGGILRERGALAREIIGYGPGGKVPEGRVSLEVFRFEPASGKDDGKNLKDW